MNREAFGRRVLRVLVLTAIAVASFVVVAVVVESLSDIVFR